MKLAAALLLLGSVARAEVAAELSAGAGGDTTAPTGFAMAHASMTAELSRPLPPAFERAVGSDKDDGFWIFTGIDPDDKNSIGATADATAHARASSQQLLLDARAWARGYGWQLEGRAAVEPITRFRDRFWRSGRGVIESHEAIEIPPMWAIGNRNVVLAACTERIELGQRSDHGTDGGLDDEVSFTGARVQTRHTTVDVFRFQMFELGTARKTVGLTTYGTSVSGLDFDIASVTVKTDDLQISARGGVAVRYPVGPYEHTGTTVSYTGPTGDAPSYWLELQTHGVTLGGGSWIRLDPSAHAVDAGQLAALSLDEQLGHVKLHGELEAGRLRRIATGLYAPPELRPVGTRMWLGRAALSSELPLTGSIGLAATAWVERSDRDDPRWSVPANGDLATHAGADVTASWRFQWIPHS